MPLIDWYIIKKFLTTYFFLIIIVVSIAIIFDFNERIDKLIACPATWQQICFVFYLNWIPYFANLFSPLFVFISVSSQRTQSFIPECHTRVWGFTVSDLTRSINSSIE